MLLKQSGVRSVQVIHGSTDKATTTRVITRQSSRHVELMISGL